MNLPTTILNTIRLLTIFLLPLTLLAQEEEKNNTHNAWIELGSLRFSPTEYEKGIGVNAVLKYQRNHLLYAVQYHNYIDKELTNGGLGLFNRSFNRYATNLMIGLTNKRAKLGHASISSGLGIFGGDIGIWREGTDLQGNPTRIYREEKFTSLCWPIEVAASLNILPFFGLNLKFFANINSAHSFVGFGMDLQFGKMRDFKAQELLNVIR